MNAIPDDIPAFLDSLFRRESGRILATLMRLLGDLDLAEDGMHDAFAAALEKWPQDGIPEHPRAWLISTGRFKAIDRLRRHSNRFQPIEGSPDPVSDDGPDLIDGQEQEIDDDRLRLLFICCHPILAPEASTALTLREVCGLTTEEIARAFLTSPATLAQRIVRAKARIRDARLPYVIPNQVELPDRLEAVIKVIYLVFNEGYSVSSGDAVTRPDLSLEAIRLGRLLLELMPDPEVMGLLALMLLHESRRAARTSGEGELILLEHQARGLWDQTMIAEGKEWVAKALASGRWGAYVIQAAIAEVHADAREFTSTDWNRIIGLYGLLARMAPSPIVDLNQAVAVAMRDGAQAGLDLVDAIHARGELDNYHLLHAVRADFCRRLERNEAARLSYQRALQLTRQGPEQRFLQRRIAELSK